ncbi:MAG: transcription antitermination factor NusB [Hyphomicrobiaceae bacterium]
MTSGDEDSTDEGGKRRQAQISPLRQSQRARRSIARLAAVQALYQMDLAQTDLADVIADYRTRRFGTEGDEMSLEEADEAFFAALLKGVVARQREIDPLVDAQLAEGWRLTRVDAILRAILRAGVYELLARRDVPAKVAISEYVEVARAFFDDEEPKVTNGVLDGIGRRVRPEELV